MWDSLTWSRNVFAKSNVSSQCPHMYSIPVGSVASSSWFNRCWSNILGDENFILHSLHSNSLATSFISLFVLSPLWILLCVRKLCARGNFFSQTSHLKGFSPVWVLLCRSKLLDILNPWPHTSHLKGFSPVWILLCFFKELNTVNALSQTSHLKGFSPVWILLCVFKFHDDVNALLQTSHLKGFSPVWVLLCGPEREIQQFEWFLSGLELAVPTWQWEI